MSASLKNYLTCFNFTDHGSPFALYNLMSFFKKNVLVF